MCKIAIPLILTISFSISSLATAQTLKDVKLRVWHDQRGNEITARLIRYKDGIVYLRSNRRQSIQVQPGQLSAADRKYIAETLLENKQEQAAQEFERLAKETRSTGNGTPGNQRDGSVNPPGNSANGFQKGGIMKSPAGDSPVASGGRVGGRAPSQYLRTPDDEAMDLQSGNRRRDSNIDPFADLSRGNSARSSLQGNASTTVGNKIRDVPNSKIDPFAEVGTVNRRKENAERSRVDDSKSGSTQAISESGGNKGYTPPVIPNKADHSVPSGENSEATTTDSAASGSQTLIVVGIGVVALLLLVTIALLVMVLTKNNAPQRRLYR